MTVNLLVDGNQAKAAIYTGDDDLPFAAPLSYPSRVMFHSDLPTIGIKSQATISVVLPAKSALGGTSYLAGRTTVTLSAHGQAGTPLVEGYISSGLSRRVTLAGSVMIDPLRRIHLGADSTNIYLQDMWLQTPAVVVPSFSLSIVVFVTDYLL